QEERAVPRYNRGQDNVPATDATGTSRSPGAYGGVTPREEEASSNAPTPANIAVHLPAGAGLYLEGVPSKQTSAIRYYQTRPLARGEEVSYTFRAEMTVGGKTISDSKVVTLRAGYDAVVKFDTLLAAAAAPAAPGKEAPSAPSVASR